MSVKKFYDYCNGEMREVDTDEVSDYRIWVRYEDYEKLEAESAHWGHKYTNARQYNRNLEERCKQLEVERDKWEARAVALFWSGSVNDATMEEIRKATAEYKEWKDARRTQSTASGGSEHG